MDYKDAVEFLMVGARRWRSGLPTSSIQERRWSDRRDQNLLSGKWNPEIGEIVGSLKT